MRRGRRVGVTAPSHKAIHNLLEEIERVAREQGVRFRGYKRGDGDNAYVSPFGDAGDDRERRHRRLRGAPTTTCC